MFKNRTISYNATLLEALKKMDVLDKKLLIVLDDNKFFGLLSAGDIQRAVIQNKPLDTKVADVLRKNIRIAKPKDSFETIRQMMFDFRMELCPVVNEQKKIIEIYFWEDVFQDKGPQPKKQFNSPVVIMAGGFGTRLKPITNVLPKPLIPIGEKTIIEHIFQRFSKHGCNTFHISVNYKADLIEYYLKNQNLPYQLAYFQEEKPMGTAGSLSLLKDKIKETFFVSNCDILIEQDYSEILDYHKTNKNDITIVAALKHYPIPYGTIETTSNGQLVSLQEKPELTFKINSGMYILEPHLINDIPENQFFHITHLIEKIHQNGGKVGVFPVSEKSWKDIGEWDEYLKTMVISKKRILLIGDGNHQFIINYVHWLKKASSNNFAIDILSFSELQKENKILYDTIHQIGEGNALFAVISKIKGIRRFYRFHLYRKTIDKLPSYDIVHFHFISADSYYLAGLLKKNTSSKIILSIWGSDMYRVNSSNRKDFLDTCQLADVLTFTNKKSIDYFKTKYNWQKNNLNLCRFGLAPLENLKQLTLSRGECKNHLKWNDKKQAVTIGYNLSPAQQHLEILSQFDNEKIKELKDKIQLILPITYGGTPEYKNQLLQKLKQLPFEYVVYDRFLTDDKIAQIRQASDIMIQLQLTDQFSGSMQEHLFTCNVVITGSWLPYETMREHGAWFIEIDKLEELSKVIPDVVHDFEKYEQQTKNNPQAIIELSSWEKNIHDWLALYNN